MKNRKAIAFVMVLAMIFCYIPPATYAIEQPTNFVDMPQEGFWSTQALQAAVNNGLLQGFEKPEGFYVKPNDTLTRAQMATIVNRAFGATEKAELSGVADVPENAWYREEIQKAVKMGTMKSAQKMRPNDPITRQEAFTVLARAFRATGGTTDHLVQFQDAGLVASWALDGMGALVQDGYVKGSGGKLSPKNNITRAEFAVIMDNMVKQYVKVAGTVTDVVSEGNVVINVPGATLKDVTISGDLIIGDGVGNGNITLDNVTVQGDLIARGGGVNSIIIVGGSVEGKIVVSKVDGQIRVSVEGGAEVEVIVVDDGQDDVILEGTIGTVEITAAETPVLVRNANIQQVTIAPSAIGSSLQVSGTVSNLTVQGQGATVTANSGGTITNVTSQSDGVTITGTGNVGAVIVEGNNTTVNTNNTSVTLNTGVVGTIINDEPQDTPTEQVQLITEEEEPVISGGGGGGTPSPTVLVAEIEVTSTAIEITTDNGTLSMTAVVSPAGATNRNVTWEVDGTAATINSSGLLTAITNGAVTVFAVAQDGSGVSGQLEITISGQVPDIVDYPTIAGVEMPAKGDRPEDISFTETDQFTGTISWSPDDSPFGSSTSYTATITLTAKDGYTLTGIANNFFIVPGATTVSSVGHIVTAQYPVTDPPEYSTTGALTVDSIAVTYGATSAEALGRLGTLIPTVSVSGTLDGESDTATITWISITGYNGTSAGAYTATGTLALPADWIGTPSNVTATVNVSPAALDTISRLDTTEVWITYGATSAQAIALLDTSVGITGTLGERGTADIVWNITGYDATSAGAYEAVGTLTLPNSWTGTGQVTATVNVSPAAYASTDVLAVTSVSVTYGAAEAEALGLLQSTVPTVGVNGTNGEDGTATITWTTIAAYNATSPGSYVASGTLGLPASWSGSPGAVTATVIVLPVEYISTEALTTQAIWVTYGATSAEAIALLDTQAVVNGTNDEQATVNITWTDITNYSGTSAGAYEAIGELAIPGSWIYTGDQPTVSAIVNVSPAAFAAADELTTTRIYVTYGATSIQAIALLDTSVGITGTLGERGTATITWDIPIYSGETGGINYLAIGTLTLSDSWTYVGDQPTVSAIVTVSPAAYASTDALAVASVSVTYGATSSEAILLLDDGVGITGTNGERGTATIIWDIPGYVATSSGAYEAVGILNLPIGWSGSPGAVTAAVIVLPVEYISTEALTTQAIWVTYGATSVEAIALLDTQAVVNGTNSEQATVNITWTEITGYNGTSAGAYTATGTLTLPTDWIGTPGSVTATVNVSPAAYASADSLTAASIYVTYGATSAQAIALLDTSVGITGTLGERGTADITWDIPEYVATSAGAYTATGTLTLPSSWTYTGEQPTVSAIVNVSPAAYASTDALTTTSISVTYGATSAEALGLLQSTVPTVGVNGTNGEDGTATITWTAIAAYDATSPGSYVASGTLGLPASWSGSPGAVTAAVIVLPQGDQSGFTLAVMPGAPTIEGIQFGLSITNAATTAGESLVGAYTVVVSSQEGYLGTYDDSVVDGGTGQLTTFSTSVEFVEGGGGLPIFISAPGIFHLTVTVEGITTSQSIEVVITESAADISYEVPVIYLGSTTPAYITVTGIWDASGNYRADDFSNNVGMMFDFGLLFEDDPEQIPGVVTKSATSMLIEIPNPSLLTTPGAYKITIDMEDGNWWNIPFEVTVSAVGYTPQQMALYARFGSLVLDMEIEDSEGNILTWAAISDDVNLEESVIEIQASSGEVTPVVITFGGLVSHINDIANTITFDGEPGLTGLSGMSTSDFAIGGILEGFLPFEHDTVNVTLKAIDATWLVTASAVIPYLSIQHGQNVGDTLDLTVVYENMEGPTLSALSPANVNLLPAFSTEYDTASDNKVTVAAMGGGEYLYAYAWIPVPEMTTDGINTLEMAYDAGNNTFTISGTKDNAVTVDAIGVLYFYDSSTQTLNYINLDFYTGAGEGINVDINYMPRVEEVTSDDGGSTLTVVFDSAMSGSSITNTANYTYSSSGNPITIAAVSYDEGAWAATVTIQGIVEVGDLFTISNDNELVDVQGFELSQQQYLLTTGGVWIENMGGPGGPEDPISLYEDEGGTAPSSTFEIGTMVYVLINDPSQSRTTGASVSYHVFSATDSTGVTLAAVDNTGTNMFGSAFFISGMPSRDTPGSYNLNTTIGGMFTVTYDGDSVTATSIEPGGGGGSVPDGLNVEVEFGSLELYIDPTIGGAVTTMSSVGVISPSSVICFFEVENPTNKIEYTLSELGADENVTIDWENNLVVLSGAVEGFARSGAFTTSPAGLLSGFQYGIHDRVMVTLSGIVGETPYEVTTEAIIPYIGLGNASQSGLTLIYDVEVNYDLSLTEEEAGSYTNVSLYGLSYSPGIEGAALEAIEATTPVAVGDGGADQIGRLQAFYVGEEVPEEEYSMDNIGDVLMTLDPTTSTYAITATKTDANTTISAFIHLFLVDTEYGNRSFATFEILSDAGSSDVLVQEMGMPPGDVALTTTASHITWTPQADATGYVINLYKDYETETTPIYTTTVGIDGVLPFEIGPTIYSLGAGTGNYSARVQILGGTSDGVWLESSGSVYVTQMEQVTGLIVSGGVLHWDLLSSNNYGVEIYISYGEDEQPLITTLNDGESGYDLMANGVLTDSAMDYTISVYAAGEPYTVIKSMTPATIVFHDDRQDPTGATGGDFYGFDNNAVEGQSFEEVGGYGVGDAIRLMFTEPIRYDNLAISDFQLSEGSDWGTTTEGAITFDDGVENYFGAYSEGIIIELQTGTYIASTASITIPEGALQDILGNTNSAVAIPVEEPFMDSSGTTHASVDTYEEFVSAMADEAIELIGINQDMSATTFAITRPIEILFDGHTLTGTVSITTSALGEVTLSAPGTIAGILMIDAPNLTVNNEVTVTGETIIEGVGYDSYNSSGSQGGGILVHGPARLNLSAAASSAMVGIDTSQMVVLDGSIQTVQLMASGSKARVLGAITTLSVTTGAIGSLVEAYSGSSIGQVLASESTMLMKEAGATIGSTTGAVLENVAYRVTFDKNGGDTQASPTYLLWDNNTETSNAMPTPPTKTDYVFGGWNRQSDGGGTIITTAYAVSSPVTAYAIWEAGDVEIEGYDSFTPIDGGDVGTPAYEDATAVITYLESTLTCAAITGQSQVVPISGWADTDSYTSSVAASYTFTASVGTLPEGFVDEISPITHVTVEVVVSAVEPPVITTITAVEGGTLTAGIDDGDTITIEFDVPTNYANLPSNPGTVSQEGVDSFIQLHTDRLGVTPTLGAAYYGFWETTTRFVITIDDSTGANLIVGDEISIRQSADLKTQNELSVASTSRAEVTGSFDPVYNGAVGLVKSTTGMAISGVEVYAGSIGSSYSDITDENGMYEIDYPTEGSITTFYVHDYWFDDVFDNRSVPNPGYFEKTMSIGAKITGTVTYNGSWAVGFTVKDGSAGTEAIVGADGSFSLRGVPSGTGGSTRYLNVLNLSGISVIEGSLIEVETIAFQTTSGVAIVIP